MPVDNLSSTEESLKITAERTDGSLIELGLGSIQDSESLVDVQRINIEGLVENTQIQVYQRIERLLRMSGEESPYSIQLTTAPSESLDSGEPVESSIVIEANEVALPIQLVRDLIQQVFVEEKPQHGIIAPDSPIEIPRHPYIQNVREFGELELVAAGLNFGSTGISELVFKFFPELLDPVTQKIFLGFIGTIAEKGWFPVEAVLDTRHKLKTTPPKFRKSGREYLKDASKKWVSSQFYDLFHDIGDIVSLLALQFAIPQVPAFMWKFVSFSLGVLLAAGVKTGTEEMKYRRIQKILQAAGFEPERYYESRFLIDSQHNPEDVVGQISEEFGLSIQSRGTYNDRYFWSNLPEYSGRRGKSRLRQRTNPEVGADSWMQTAQLIFTRAGQEATKNPDQFAFYPVKKTKFYRQIEGAMPGSLDEIEDPQVRAAMQRFSGAFLEFFQFDRLVGRDPKTLFASADIVHAQRPFNVVELKAYPGKENLRRLQEAMRFVMMSFVTLQTTRSKLHLVHSSNGEGEGEEQ